MILKQKHSATFATLAACVQPSSRKNKNRCGHDVCGNVVGTDQMQVAVAAGVQQQNSTGAMLYYVLDP